MKRIVLAAFILSSIGFWACKKDKIIPIKDRIIGKWTYVKYGTQNPPGAQEIFTMMPEDAYGDFKADGNLTWKDTGEALPTKWTLLENDTILQIGGISFTKENYVINQLDAHNLICTTEQVVNGQTISYTFYFTRP